MVRFSRWHGYAGAAFLLSIASSAIAETGWPIEQVDADHPLGNTLGEFVQGASDAYQHEGIDILAPAFDQEGPFAIVTVSGFVENVVMNPDSRDNFIMIRPSNGQRRYRYAHLEYSTIPSEITLLIKNTPGNAATLDQRLDQPGSWPPLQAGERIAQLSNLFECGFSHLHYEIQRHNDDDTYSGLNPLLDIEPRTDTTKPEVVNIFLAKRDGEQWEEIEKNPDSSSCTQVSGDVDIIAEIVDRDDAGSTLLGTTNVGIYRLRWRACKWLTCSWKEAVTFDVLPGDWTIQGNPSTKKLFSVNDPWRSSSDYCAGPEANKSFMVPTRVSSAGTWQTASGNNGNYTVSVQAIDVNGNKGANEIDVCVEN